MTPPLRAKDLRSAISLRFSYLLFTRNTHFCLASSPLISPIAPPTDTARKTTILFFTPFIPFFFDSEAYSLLRQLMLAKSCTKLEKMSTLFVVFFPGAYPLLIYSILLTITSRTPLVTYERQACSDVGISPFDGSPLGKSGSHWESLSSYAAGITKFTA